VQGRRLPIASDSIPVKIAESVCNHSDRLCSTVNHLWRMHASIKSNVNLLIICVPGSKQYKAGVVRTSSSLISSQTCWRARPPAKMMLAIDGQPRHADEAHESCGAGTARRQHERSVTEAAFPSCAADRASKPSDGRAAAAVSGMHASHHSIPADGPAQHLRRLYGEQRVAVTWCR
jgi:hypothetical protein